MCPEIRGRSGNFEVESPRMDMYGPVLYTAGEELSTRLIMISSPPTLPGSPFVLARSLVWELSAMEFFSGGLMRGHRRQKPIIGVREGTRAGLRLSLAESCISTFSQSVSTDQHPSCTSTGLIVTLLQHPTRLPYTYAMIPPPASSSIPQWIPFHHRTTTQSP